MITLIHANPDMRRELPEEPTGERFRYIRIPFRVVVAWLHYQPRAPQYVEIPTLQLPEGYRVLAASLDPFGLYIRVLVYHPSFSPVPHNQDIPEYEPLERELLKVCLYELRNPNQPLREGEQR